MNDGAPRNGLSCAGVRVGWSLATIMHQVESHRDNSATTLATLRHR